MGRRMQCSSASRQGHGFNHHGPQHGAHHGPHHAGHHLGMGGGRCERMGAWRSERPGKPVLTYFDISGLAEQARLTFIIGGVPFVDRRITREDWTNKYKAYSPSGQVPYLEVDGEVLVQSRAILHYAARRAAMMPEDGVDALAGMMALGMLDEARAYVIAKMGVSEEEKAAAVTKIIDENYTHLDALIARTISAEGFSLSNRLTYVDVAIATSFHLFSHRMNIPVQEVLAKLPTLTRVYDAVYKHPRVVAYYGSQKTTIPVLTYFDFTGRAEAARWAFTIGGIEFEDNRVTKEEWNNMKETSPNRQLPLLQVGEKTYAESNAILLYAAKRAGLVPSCDFAYAHGVSVLQTGESVFCAFVKALHAADEERKKEIVEKMLPPLLETYNTIVGAHQDEEGHVTGQRLSFADLYTANLYQLLNKLPVANLHEKVPNLDKVFRMVMLVPAMKSYEVAATGKPILTYFDAAGRAEPIRFVFRIGNVDFEDRRITFEEWTQTYKSMSPTGQCPFLEINGMTITEVKAIMTYAAEAADLMPVTLAGRVRAEEIHSAWLTRIVAEQKKVYAHPEGELRDNAVKQITTETMPGLLEIMEKMVAPHGTSCPLTEGYLVERKLTWIDVYIGAEFNLLVDREMVRSDYAEAYPTLTATRNMLYAVPQLKSQ